MHVIVGQKYTKRYNDFSLLLFLDLQRGYRRGREEIRHIRRYLDVIEMNHSREGRSTR